MGVERSTEFTSNLERVRKMPQSYGKPGETDSEASERELQNAEKREAAKILRMEAFLENAKCTQLLVEFLEQNPHASIEELEEYIVKNAKVIHPKNLNNFIELLTKERDRASTLVNLLITEDKGKRLSQDPAIRLYQGLCRLRRPSNPKTRKPIHPEGPINLDDTYPLALILNIKNENDFANLDERNNIGGFYNPHKPYSQPKVGGLFPIIVTQGNIDRVASMLFGKTPITSHEKGHAENHAFSGSLGKKVRCVWGHESSILASAKNRLKELWGVDKKITIESQEYQEVLQYALASAKNELLADYKAEQHFGHAASLKTKGGLYDYFIHHGITPEESPTLYTQLWKDYEEAITNACKAAEKITNLYGNTLSSASIFMGNDYDDRSEYIGKRVELFRWILAQIPLEEWAKQLAGVPFLEEAKQLDEAFKTGGLIKNLDNNDSSKPVLEELYREFTELTKLHQDQPLFEISKNFLEKVKAIKPEIKTSE